MPVGFKAKNHSQQTKYAGSRRHCDERSLPPVDFAKLQERFHLTVDVAASKENTKLGRYYSIEDSGLDASWAGERVYCNPPFSAIPPWIEKAWAETDAELIVMLLPANRTEQAWWQELIEPHRDVWGSGLQVEFMAGRLRFLKPGQTKIGPNERPPFGCCLCIWS